MTGSHAAMDRGRLRRRQRIASIAGLVALVGAVVVTVAAPARAVVPCTQPNLCPFANDDNYQAIFNTKLTVDAAHGLLANDEGPAGTKIEFGGCTETESFWSGANIAVKSDGSFTYSPDLANPYSGADSFDYCIIDPVTGNDDFATAYIDVLAVARPDFYGTHPDAPLTVNAPGLLANDGGIDPDFITLDETSAMGGTVTDNFDGAFVYTPPAGYSGPDAFGYTGWDIDGDYEYGAAVTIYVDGDPPVASMAAMGPVTLGTTMPVAWSGSDVGTGLQSFDVQYRKAVWNGPFGLWTPLLTATVKTSTTVGGTYGRTFCFRVRARDKAGNYSLFTTQRCTSIPLPAKSLKYSSRWTRTSSPLYYGGEAFATSYKGQTATLSSVQAQHMWLVATKCATCGTVQVRWNNVVIANVNLAQGTTAHRKLIPIAAFATPRTGTVSMYVTSPTGKVVKIEGLAVLRA
jgi:Cadherin-like domain/Bacterial Ig domain